MARSEKSQQHSDEVVREYRGTGVFWILVLFFVPVVLLIIALAQNTERVQFEFLWLNLSPPLFVVVLVAAAAGAAATEGLAAAWRHQRRKQRNQHEELVRLRSTVEGSPTPPAADAPMDHPA